MLISEYNAKRCWTSLKGRRFDGVNTCYAFLAMEKSGELRNLREDEEHRVENPALLRELFKLTAKKAADELEKKRKKNK